MSGPEIQANAIWTALHGLPLRDAPGWTGVLALLLLGAAPALAHCAPTGSAAAVLAPVAALAFAAVAQVAFDARLDRAGRLSAARARCSARSAR